jgi:hypothetical protein
MQHYKNTLRGLLAVLALLLVGSLPSLAQTFRGGINGSITDPASAGAWVLTAQ